MKGVIFDFNGTLFNDHEKHVQAWSSIAEELRGYGVSEKELKENCNGKINVEIIDYLSPVLLSKEEKEKYSQKKEAVYRKLCVQDSEGFHLISGAENLFKSLQAKSIPFTIASASIIENIRFFIESFHLDQYMNPESIVYDDGILQNKEQMFLKAAKNLDTDIRHILIFEDSITGVKGALDADAGAVVLMDPEHESGFVTQYDLIKKSISSFDEISADEIEKMESVHERQ